MGVPISSLPAASDLTGAEQIPVVQSGVTKRTTTDAMPYTPAGTGAVATTVQAKLRETVSVKDFGAVGDGATNDVIAFEKAIAESNYVYIPEGEYYFATTLTISESGKTLYGPGILKGNPALPSASQVINVTGSNVTLKNFTINQNNMNAGRSIWISGAYVTVDGVKSYNTQSAFIELRSGASYVVVRNCYQNGGGYGVISSDHGLGPARVENNTFIHPGAGYAIGDGVEFNNPTTGCQDIQITGNYINGYRGASDFGGLGIGIAKGTFCVVANNIVKNCEADGIHVEDQSSFVIVEGNIVEDCCINLTYGSAAIMVYLTSNSVIANNIIKGATGGHGIMLSGFGTDQYVYNNKVTGNHISTVREAGILLNGSNRTVVSGNIIEAVNGANSDWAMIDMRRIGASTKYNVEALIDSNICIEGFPSAYCAVKGENADTGQLTNNDLISPYSKLVGIGSNFRRKLNKYASGASYGTITLTAGTSTVVNNANVYSIEQIALTPRNAGAAGLASVYVSAFTGGTSFTITHSSAVGSEQFYYELE